MKQLLNDNSEFEFKLYVPRNGKSIKIVAYDLKGNKAVQNLELKRPIIENNSGPKFSLLNPNLNKVKANKKAIALIIGVANYEKTSAKAVFADRDAKMFYDYANLKLGIPKSNIKGSYLVNVMGAFDQNKLKSMNKKIMIY